MFGGRCKVDESSPVLDWDGPYHGLDFDLPTTPRPVSAAGFTNAACSSSARGSQDRVGTDATAGYVSGCIPGIEDHVIRADSSRPESISYLMRYGPPRITACRKWAGSVEDGIEYIKSSGEIIIPSALQRRCSARQGLQLVSS